MKYTFNNVGNTFSAKSISDYLKAEHIETDDVKGNIIQTETAATTTFLYITVSHKTVDEMSQKYGFNQKQKDYLAELPKDENTSLWATVLYGINY